MFKGAASSFLNLSCGFHSLPLFAFVCIDVRAEIQSFLFFNLLCGFRFVFFSSERLDAGELDAIFEDDVLRHWDEMEQTNTKKEDQGQRTCRCCVTVRRRKRHPARSSEQTVPDKMRRP